VKLPLLSRLFEDVPDNPFYQPRLARWLPAVNATGNGLSAIFLTAGYLFIQRKKSDCASQNRPLDLAALDVCLCHRGHHLPSAPPDFSTAIGSSLLFRGLVLLRQIGENQPMSAVANVFIHASQFPEAVRRDLLESLRTRKVNHKFHYDSVRQTQKWLALHQACSPSRNDTDCQAVYERGFEAAAARVKAKRVHLIGLGCGGGQKDSRLLKLLRDSGKEVSYTPCDVSTAMVLTARRTVLTVVPEKNCFPLVCDLATADDLPEVLEKVGSARRADRTPRRGVPTNPARLVTFFGMIPNFEPQTILPRLASLIQAQDSLLFSANLAPGPDFAAGVRRILPQYDNPLTRDWLMTFLLDLGVEQTDGELRFVIEDDPAGNDLKRVAASFHFNRRRRVEIESEAFEFRRGESVRVFFSYRYTPGRVRQLLGKSGLAVQAEWITKSEEEGVFLCRRKQRRNCSKSSLGGASVPASRD